MQNKNNDVLRIIYEELKSNNNNAIERHQFIQTKAFELMASSLVILGFYTFYGIENKIFNNPFYSIPVIFFLISIILLILTQGVAPARCKMNKQNDINILFYN